MRISTLWHDEDTICMVFEPGWTWDAFDEAAQRAAAEIEGCDHHVDLLFDLREVRDFPTEGLGYHLPRMMSLLPANHGHLIVLGASEVIRTTFMIFARAMDLPPLVFTETLPGSNDSALRRTG
jgi:hypothetical protein